MRGRVLLLAGIFSLTSCADQATRDYIANIQSLQTPIDQDGRIQACQGLDAEISDQQNREDEAQRLAPLFAADARRQFGERVAALNEKKQQDGCDQLTPAASAPSPVIVEAPPSNPIEQCVAACKANTARSATQCFDECNHR